jgi:hypothetical protein
MKLTFTPADDMKKALIDTTCDITINALNDSPDEKIKGVWGNQI